MNPEFSSDEQRLQQAGQDLRVARGNIRLKHLYAGITAVGTVTAALEINRDGVDFWVGVCSAAGTVLSGIATYVSHRDARKFSDKSFNTALEIFSEQVANEGE